MDIETIDQQYSQVQSEFQDVAKSIQEFAEKLQSAAAAGDQNARDWLLDLRQIALDVKDEQLQVGSLLQAIHGWAANSAQSAPPAQAPAYQPPPQQQAYPPQQGYPQPGFGGFGGGMGGGGGMFGGGMGGGSGMFGGLLNSGFGRAMEMGAGIGLGDELINSIF